MSLIEKLLVLFVVNQYIFLLWNLYRDSKHLSISISNLLLNKNYTKDIEDNYKVLQAQNYRLKLLEEKIDRIEKSEDDKR